MTDKQPEALFLADQIDSDYDPDWMYEVGLDRIAAKLRRLNEVNAAMSVLLDEAWPFVHDSSLNRRIRTLLAQLNSES